MSGHSQVRTQENVQSTGTWKQEKDTSSNDSSWRRERRTVSAADVKTGFCNMKITDFDYISKISRLSLKKKMGIPEGKESFASLRRWRHQSMLD